MIEKFERNLRDEEYILSDRVEKLSIMLMRPENYKFLRDETDVQLLRLQLMYMQNYLSILRARMKILGIRSILYEQD